MTYEESTTETLRAIRGAKRIMKKRNVLNLVVLAIISKFRVWKRS